MALVYTCVPKSAKTMEAPVVITIKHIRIIILIRFFVSFVFFMLLVYQFLHGGAMLYPKYPEIFDAVIENPEVNRVWTDMEIFGCGI